MALTLQPNSDRSYKRRRLNDQFQPPLHSGHHDNVDGSYFSFPSNEWTHPSALFQRNASDQTSGSFNELASRRGLSFRTPTTPTNSSDGGYFYFKGEVGLYRQCSPANAERELQGISSASHDPGHYPGDPKIDAAVPGDRHHESFGDFQPMQIDCQHSISARIPAPKTQLQGPWSEWDRVYTGQSHLGDALEEGLVFCQHLNYDFWSRQSKQYDLHHNGRGAFNIFSQQNPTDTQQHLHPLFTGTDHAYEGDERANIDSLSSATSASSCSPASSPTDTLPNHGGRRGPLPQPVKENANKTRKRGSCFRCYIMKERCVINEQGERDGICERCREILNDCRTWALPCSNLKLQDRSGFMLPEDLVSHLRPCKVREYFELHTNGRLTDSPSFKLALEMDFDTLLVLDVVEFALPDQKNAQMMGFQLTSGGSSTVMLDSPPVMPFIVDKFAIWRQLYTWLESVSKEESKFPENCFPESHEYWPRKILADICTHYRECISEPEVRERGSFETFRWAMKLTVLNHIMCHPFTVPDCDVESLLDQLHNYKPTGPLEWVCPRVVNKVIKHYCVPMLQKAKLQVLEQLNTILRSGKVTEALWDQAFSIVFLCLIAIGKNQVALLEKAGVCVANGDDSFTVEHAMDAVKKMENELAEHLIGMFHQRFSTNKKGNGNGKSSNPFARNPKYRPQSMTRLMKSVGSATELYGWQNIIDMSELPLIDPDKMKYVNVTRLLCKFMRHFAPLDFQA